MRHLLQIPARLAVLSCLVTGTPVASVAPAPTQPDYTRVDAFLRDSTVVTAAPGLAYAIITPREIEHVGTWGHDGNGEPVTADTPFLWGSVSKPVTATAVLTLVESGELSLDEPVRSYLPEFSLADEGVAAQITVRQLLEQTSGIPEGIGVTDRFDDRPDPYLGAVADLAEVEPVAPPGEAHEYASANYLVLGALVEAVTRQTFTDYLHDSVLAPLGMGTVIATAEQAAMKLPPGHRVVFGQPVGFTTPYDPTGPSYGYLGGSVVDLARFAAAQLGNGRLGEVQVLSPESVELMHTGRARVSDIQAYGLGWRDDARNTDLGTRTIWHAGAVSGYQAIVVLLPDADRGIVVLHNLYGVFQDSQLAAVGLTAARILAGGEPAPLPEHSEYVWLLTGLTLAVVVLLAVGAWSAYRLFRPSAGADGRAHGRARRVSVAAGWTLGCVAMAYAAVVSAPAIADARLTDLLLWAPDLGWLLVAVAVGAVVLGVLRLVLGVRGGWCRSGLVRQRLAAGRCPLAHPRAQE